MSDTIAEIFSAIRNDDVGRWMNVLIVVVLAAFWAIASLVKAKKAEQQDEEEQPSRRPGQKPSARSQRMGTELSQQRARPRPAGRVAAARYRHQPQPRPRPPLAMPPEPAAKPVSQQKLPSLSVSLEPDIQALPETTTPSIQGLPQTYGPAAGEPAKYEPVFESLLDYDDPSELRRAILHYEILGKPLSLRGPGGQIIGL
jgi:hypothetical protein